MAAALLSLTKNLQLVLLACVQRDGSCMMQLEIVYSESHWSKTMSRASRAFQEILLPISDKRHSSMGSEPAPLLKLSLQHTEQDFE